MKKAILIGLLFPALLNAQQKTPVKAKAKIVEAENKAEGFVINGEVTGCADGTKVALINGLTGQPEQNSGIYQNKFSFKGKLAKPAFRIILIDNKQPYLTIFLDNSDVKVVGAKETFDKSVVSGSASNDELLKFNSMMAPYMHLFTENGAADEKATAPARKQLENYIEQNKTSYISPFAVMRYMNLSTDIMKADQLFNSLAASVRSSDLGNYLSQQIADAKINAIGTEMPNFSQSDTAGNMVSLSSLRGKYVLVDFWASWCGPCRAENPNVAKAYNKYSNKNFTVLGVSLDRKKEDWLEAIKQDGLSWKQISDLKQWETAARDAYQFEAIPYNVLVDPQGKILATSLRGEELDAKLAEILK